MDRLKVFLLGTLYGVIMRVLFGLLEHYHTSSFGDNAFGAMLFAFAFLVPFLIGFYTIHQSKDKVLTWVIIIFSPWVPTFLFVLGTALILIEGSICIAMALPLFLFASSLGGITSFLVIKWKKPKSSTVHSLLLLPLLITPLEMQIELPQTIYTSTQTIWIAAQPEKVWHNINNITDIKPEELDHNLAHFIGVPYPLEGFTQTQPDGSRIRKSHWQKNVSFDEPITQWDENRLVKWTYDFKPNSFPAGALDDHVMIGGKYFDLIDTSYQLTPENNGTRLTVSVHYRISTNFNWYASQVGQLLIDSAAKTFLKLYKRRSEKPMKAI